MTTPTKMKPSKNAIPFASGGTILPAPIVNRIDRGIRDLAVNYGLKGRLLPLWMQAANGTWNFALYLLAEEEKRNFVELITDGDMPKPIVNVTHKSISGINKFLVQAGQVIAKKYGTETQQRRSA